MAQNQNIEHSSNHIKFSRLPKIIQERLLQIQRGERDGFAFQTAGIIYPVILVLLGICWVGIVIYLTDDYLWSNIKTIILSIISLIALYLLLDNTYKLIRWLISPLKKHLLISPHYVIETHFNDIRFWDLESLITLNHFHNYQNGKYTSTKVALSLEDGVTKTFVIKDLDRAEEAIEQIFHYKKLFTEAKAKNDNAYLDSNDDFIELKTEKYQSKKPSALSKNLEYLTGVAGSILLTAGLMFGGTSLNDYYDDKRNWHTAESINRASSYRNYLQIRPQGRWSGDARHRLQEFYNAAEQKYKTSLNEGYDPKAVEAVLQVLNYAKTTQNYRVQIIFERRNDIPENVVEELKKEFEVDKILPLGDTFSESKMSKRESGLFSVVVDAFKQVIPDDVLEFSNQCAGECVIFKVNYKIGKDTLYYDTRQEDLPDSKRTFYPGIIINWNFNINIPNQSQNYNFELVSSPAETITYDSNSPDTLVDNEDFSKVLEVDKNYIYDAMAASAFDDFKTNLVRRMGIGTSIQTNNEKDAVNIEIAPTTNKNKSN